MAVMLPHPAGSPPLTEKFVLVGVSVWPVCVCEWVMCGGQKSVMGVFLNPSLYFWRHSFSWNLKFTSLSSLAGQGAPGILLSLSRVRLSTVKQGFCTDAKSWNSWPTLFPNDCWVPPGTHDTYTHNSECVCATLVAVD